MWPTNRPPSRCKGICDAGIKEEINEDVLLYVPSERRKIKRKSVNRLLSFRKYFKGWWCFYLTLDTNVWSLSNEINNKPLLLIRRELKIPSKDESAQQLIWGALQKNQFFSSINSERLGWLALQLGYLQQGVWLHDRWISPKTSRV